MYDIYEIKNFTITNYSCYKIKMIFFNLQNLKLKHSKCYLKFCVIYILYFL